MTGERTLSQSGPELRRCGAIRNRFDRSASSIRHRACPGRHVRLHDEPYRPVDSRHRRLPRRQPLAAGGAHYVNVRYGYAIDLPPGFTPVAKPTTATAASAASADGQSEIAVWGANLLMESLSSDVQSRMQSAQDEGWTIAYRKVTSKRANWSGEKDGRIFYARAILLCHDDEAGYFRLEYPEAARDAFDPVITQLLKDFKPTELPIAPARRCRLGEIHPPKSARRRSRLASGHSFFES